MGEARQFVKMLAFIWVFIFILASIVDVCLMVLLIGDEPDVLFSFLLLIHEESTS